MALDVLGQVLTTYKADTSDHIKELKKLKGEERKLAEARLKEHQAHEERLDRQIKTIGKVAIAVGVVVAAFATAKAGFDEYNRHAKLSAAAAGVDIDKLRQASLGLKTEMELLSDAAKMQAGELKATSQEMAIAERAMVALTRRGFEAADVNQKVLEAVTSLKVDGLADLGIFVDKAGLSMETAEGRAAIYQRTLEALTKASRDVKDGQVTAAEGVEQAGVRLENAWDSLKRSLGELVVAFEPIISALAQVATYAADIVDVATRSEEEGGSPFVLPFNAVFDPEGRIGAPNLGDAILARLATMRAEQSRRRLEAVLAAGRERAVPGLVGLVGSGISSLQQVLGGDSWGGGIDLGLRRGGGARGAIPQLTRQEAQAILAQALRAEAIEVRKELAASSQLGGAAGFEGLDLLGIAGRDVSIRLGGIARDREQSARKRELAGLTEDWLNRSGLGFQTAEQRSDAIRESQLEKMFGPVGQIDMYRTAFESLTGAVSASFGAWIDGSQSAAKAFKAFIGEAVKGVALQAAVESIKEVAFGIASAAWPGGQGKAAIHFAAAAKWAGVAAFAGITAKALGGGGGGTPAPSGASGSSVPVGGSMYASGPSGGGQGSQIVYVIGSPHGGQTPRTERRRLEREARTAVGSSSLGGAY